MEKRVEWILSKIPPKGFKILDIGCNDASITKQMVKEGNFVTGIDIRSIGTHEGICTIQTDIMAETLGDKYDVVVAGEVVEHLKDTDKFLQIVKDLLTDDGNLVLTTPNIATLGRRLMLLCGKSPHIENTVEGAGHIRYYTFEDIESQLEKNGYEILESDSDEINFNRNGTIKSYFIPKLYKTLGRSIMIVAGVK